MLRERDPGDDLTDEERRHLEEKAEIVRGFLREREMIERTHEEEKEEMLVAFVTEKTCIRRGFDCEKEEMRQSFEREKHKIRMEFQDAKHVLRLSFEDEKVALMQSFELEKKEILRKLDVDREEMRRSFEKRYKEKEEGLREEKRVLEETLGKEVARLENIESELKEMLQDGLRCLERVYVDESEKLGNMFNDKPEADMHFSGESLSPNCDRKEMLKTMEHERGQMFHYHAKREHIVEQIYASETLEMEQRFKKQKNEIMKIFKAEKADMEQKFRNEKENLQCQFEAELGRVLQRERAKFQAAVQGYEHDVAILRYQKEQLEKCFSLEMENMQLKCERDKIAMESEFARDKHEIKRALKCNHEKKLAADRQRLRWLLHQFNLEGSNATLSPSSSSGYLSDRS